MKELHLPAYLQKLIDKYKYILLVLLAGVVLMLWPQSEEPQKIAEPAAAHTAVTALETRIQTLLEAMEGVGKVQVLLTLETGEETAYAYDRTESQTQGDGSTSTTRQQELVTLSESGGQSPVALHRTAPVYRGAAVVCQGGGSAAVRLAVTQVIQSLTGLSADRIVISKMKQ